MALSILDAGGPPNELKALFLERIMQGLNLPKEMLDSRAPNAAKPEKIPTPASPSIPQQTSTKIQVTALQAHDDHLKALEIKLGTPLTPDLVRRQYNLLSQKLAGIEADWAIAARSSLRTAAESLLNEWHQGVEVTETVPAVPELRYNPDLDAMFGS